MLSASSSASTTEQRIFLSIEETWNAYKTKRTALELYTADAVIMYVPTSIGVRGNAQIRKFFLNNQFSEKINPVSETIYNTLTGGNKLIEEVVWSIHFHTGECRWLLPNIEERFLTNSTIKFPVTTSVSFDQESNRIKSVRYSWDQAGVLKQLKVISEKNTWPVTGVQQIESLRSPQTAPLTGLNNQPVDVDHQKTQKEQEKTHFMPGRIFGPVDPKDQVRQPIRRPEPTAPPPRNIFTYEPPAQKPLVAHNPNKLGSSFRFTHDDGLSSQLAATKISNSSTTNNTNGAMRPAGKVTPPIVRSIIG